MLEKQEVEGKFNYGLALGSRFRIMNFGRPAFVGVAVGGNSAARADSQKSQLGSRHFTHLVIYAASELAEQTTPVALLLSDVQATVANVPLSLPVTSRSVSGF